MISTSSGYISLLFLASVFAACLLTTQRVTRRVERKRADGNPLHPDLARDLAVVEQQIRSTLADVSRKVAVASAIDYARTHQVRLNAICAAAESTLGGHIAIMTAITETQEQWLASSRPEAGMRSSELSASFCRFVVAGEAPLVIPDTRADPLVANLPAVTGPDHARAYLGVPLRDPSQEHVIGALCVLETEHPRLWSDEDVETLQSIAEHVRLGA